MVRVSLTVGKDRGPYDNKTPAALCPFNTNGKLPRFTEASSFLKGDIVLTNQTNARGEIQNQSIAVPVITGWSFS